MPSSQGYVSAVPLIQLVPQLFMHLMDQCILGLLEKPVWLGLLHMHTPCLVPCEPLLPLDSASKKVITIVLGPWT